MISEGSPSTLALIAGMLGGYADQTFHTGTAWTMFAYMAMHNGHLDSDWLYKFELHINACLASTGQQPISSARLLQRAHATSLGTSNEPSEKRQNKNT